VDSADSQHDDRSVGTHIVEHLFDEDKAGELRNSRTDSTGVSKRPSQHQIQDTLSEPYGLQDEHVDVDCPLVDRLTRQLQQTKTRPAVRISQRNTNHTFNFSVQPFTVEDLQRSTHWHKMEYFPRPYLSLNIDPHLQGLGGDDSSTASVGDDYLLLPDQYSFDLMFNFFDDAK
jgi:hypothetical protein